MSERMYGGEDSAMGWIRCEQCGKVKNRIEEPHCHCSSAVPELGNAKVGAMKFRKKPVTIEAIKWTGKNNKEVSEFILGYGVITINEEEITIPTLEGLVTASKGDWIIKGIKGEFYPCKPDIFDATYERV